MTEEKSDTELIEALKRLAKQLEDKQAPKPEPVTNLRPRTGPGPNIPTTTTTGDTAPTVIGEAHTNLTINLTIQVLG
jgi:hypothetical protein